MSPTCIFKLADFSSISKQKDQDRDNRKEAAKERKEEQKRRILLDAVKVSKT